MCKKRAIKTGKAEDVTENDKKVILCNFLETTWNDNDCFLNILIGPQVADTTFTLKILIFLDQICPKKDIFGWKQKNEYHYCISHIQISLITKFQLKLTFCFAGPNLPKKNIFGWKQRNEHHHCIAHIQISLSTKFQLKLTILLFWARFTQKGYFQLKTEKVSTTFNSPYLNQLRHQISA